LKKSELGILAVIFGAILLSIELYGLKFIHLMELKSGFPWKESPLSYLSEPNVIFAVLISIFVILLGIFLIVKDKIHFK
jgi:hypothetical protein